MVQTCTKFLGMHITLTRDEVQITDWKHHWEVRKLKHVYNLESLGHFLYMALWKQIDPFGIYMIISHSHFSFFTKAERAFSFLFFLLEYIWQALKNGYCDNSMYMKKWFVCSNNIWYVLLMLVFIFSNNSITCYMLCSLC